MKTQNEKIAAAIAEWSVPADPSRALTVAFPLRVLAGRGLVDAHGRHVLTCNARRMLCTDGDVREVYEMDDSQPGALSPCEADANVHAIARMLNSAADIADALRSLVALCENASTLGRFADGIGDELDALENARAALDGDANANNAHSLAAAPVVDVTRIVDALRELAAATYHMRDTAETTGNRFPAAHAEARDALAAYESAAMVARAFKPAAVATPALDALRANMASAVWNGETTTIGGGIFSASELRAALQELDALQGVA